MFSQEFSTFKRSLLLWMQKWSFTLLNLKNDFVSVMLDCSTSEKNLSSDIYTYMA